MGLSAVIGSLRANLVLNAQNFVGGLGQAQQAVAQFGSAIPNLTAQTRNWGGTVQNTARQLTDMGVQLGMATPVALVMSQQLPQLAAGFGVLGEVIGTLIAGGFLAWMFASKEGSDELKKSIDDLAKSTTALDAAHKGAVESTAQLAAEFGVAWEEMKRVRDLQLEVAKGNFAADFGATVAKLTGSFGDLNRQLNTYEQQAQQVIGGNSRVKESLEAMMGIPLGDNWSIMTGTIQEVQKELNATADSAAKVVAAMMEFENAKGIEEKSQAALALADTVHTAALSFSDEMNPAATELIDRLTQVAESGFKASDGIYRAGDEASVAAGKFIQGADAAYNLDAALSTLGNIDLRAQALKIREAKDAQLKKVDDSMWRSTKDADADVAGGLKYTFDRAVERDKKDQAEREDFIKKIDDVLKNPHKPPKGSSGSKAKTDAEKAQEKLERDAMSFYKSVRDPQTEYNDQIERMTSLYSKGVISLDTVKMATAQLSKDYQDSMDDIMGITRITSDDIRQSFTNSFASVLTGASSFKDAMSNLLADIGSQFIQAGLNNFLTSSIPGLFSPSGSVPFGANGFRNFTGGWAVVGEKGPELAYLAKGTNVVPNDQLGGIGGGGTNVFNFAPVTNAPNSDAGALAKLAQQQQLQYMEMKKTFGDKVIRTMRKPRFRGGN